MSVRAKMASSGWNNRGIKGAVASFNAVYESNADLQKISENAIFGDSTPNGFLELVGEWRVEKIEEGKKINDEWYVDLVEKLPAGGDWVVITPVRLAYQSAPAQGSGLTDFRWVGTGDVNVRLSMSIANPHAVAWLEEHHQAFLVLRHCNGRREAAEIAILEKVLQDQIKHVEDNATRYWGSKSPEELEKAKRQSLYWIRKKLALAKGETFTEDWGTGKTSE